MVGNVCDLPIPRRTPLWQTGLHCKSFFGGLGSGGGFINHYFGAWRSADFSSIFSKAVTAGLPQKADERIRAWVGDPAVHNSRRVLPGATS